MNSQVCRQAALATGAKTAVIASVRPLPSVHSQVCRQGALLCGLVPTVLAHMHHHRDVVLKYHDLVHWCMQPAGVRSNRLRAAESCSAVDRDSFGLRLPSYNNTVASTHSYNVLPETATLAVLGRKVTKSTAVAISH